MSDAKQMFLGLMFLCLGASISTLVADSIFHGKFWVVALSPVVGGICGIWCAGFFVNMKNKKS